MDLMDDDVATLSDVEDAESLLHEAIVSYTYAYDEMSDDDECPYCGDSAEMDMYEDMSDSDSGSDYDY